MATIINNPPSSTDRDYSALVLVLGIAAGIALIILFFVYGLPALRKTVEAPQNDTINVIVTSPLTTDTNPAPTE